MKSGISIFSDVPKHFPLRRGGASTIYYLLLIKRKATETLWLTLLQHDQPFGQLSCSFKHIEKCDSPKPPRKTLLSVVPLS